MKHVLEVKGLHIDIPLATGILHAVRDVTFSVERGKSFCLVGESGCGKSLTALAIMDLLPQTAKRKATMLSFEGKDLSAAKEREMADVRGRKMSMIFQEPMTSLNPCYSIGNQLEEALVRHKRVSGREARERAVFLLDKVGITAATSRLKQYPHQLSGGLRQRMMIAMALMCGPSLIIADEPTTALDVTTQAQLLELMKDMVERFSASLIIVTHNLGVVARYAQRIYIMYAGLIVESGTIKDIFGNPCHPYTIGLLKSLPGLGDVRRRLPSIEGTVPSFLELPPGCPFHPRCQYAQTGRCDVADPPPLENLTPTHKVACFRVREIENHD